MTQQELADKVGYTNSMVSLIEKGKTAISDVKLCKIAEVLGVDVSELMNPTEETITDGLAHMREKANSVRMDYDLDGNGVEWDSVQDAANRMVAEAMKVYESFMRLNTFQQNLVRSMVGRTEDVIANESERNDLHGNKT